MSRPNVIHFREISKVIDCPATEKHIITLCESMIDTGLQTAALKELLQRHLPSNVVPLILRTEPLYYRVEDVFFEILKS